ncbi:MAG: YdeI/OmpD-associated family protein [Nocardioides sp.]
MDGVAVNVGLNRADVIPDTFVYVGSGLRQRLGLRAGDVVRCIFVPADPDHVLVPDDVLAALEVGGRRNAFERMKAPERRRLLAPIEGAVRSETRVSRIDALIASLPADRI